MREEQFGGILKDEAEVEKTLECAQKAALHPDKPIKEFLPDGPSSTTEPSDTISPLQFSRNVICVNVTGPELVDLSFVDLPGTSAPNSPTLSLNFEALMVMYRPHSECGAKDSGDGRGAHYILHPRGGLVDTPDFAYAWWVMTFNRDRFLFRLVPLILDDIDNQRSAFLAKKYDPDGLRTIGKLVFLSSENSQ